MRKLLFTSAFGALLAALALPVLDGASASDLVFKPSEPVAPVSPPFDWTGPYIGGSAGFGWGHTRSKGSCPSPNTASSTFVGPEPLAAEALAAAAVSSRGYWFNGRCLTPGEGNEGSRPIGPAAAAVGGGAGGGGGNGSGGMNGFVGGPHIGYNYQFPNSFVLGVEGDLYYTDLKDSWSTAWPGQGNTSSSGVELKSEWQGSARLRAGYAIDNFLLYATGGIAFAEGKLTSTSSNLGTAFPSGSSSKVHVGWTVGLGAEYAFTQHWIVRAEGRYTDFQDKTYTVKAFDQTYPMKVGWDQVTATLGVSYKF